VETEKGSELLAGMNFFISPKKSQKYFIKTIDIVWNGW